MNVFLFVWNALILIFVGNAFIGELIENFLDFFFTYSRSFLKFSYMLPEHTQTFAEYVNGVGTHTPNTSMFGKEIP